MNKHILILTTFLLTLTAGQGQTNIYHPLPDTNAHWTETYWWTNFSYSTPCVFTDNYTLFFSNDTVLGTNTYRKLYKSGTLSTSYCLAANNYYNQYAGALRQDTLNKKVYYVPSYNSTEQLLYDFNLLIGDTLPISFNNGSMDRVMSIDSVLVGSQFRKRFLLGQLGNSNPPDTSFALIEGVGSTYGLYNPLTPPFESGGTLNCFAHNGQNYPSNSSCLFTAGLTRINDEKNSISVYPNPTSDQFFIQVNTTDKLNVDMYDVNGRHVFSTNVNDKSNINVAMLNEGVYSMTIKTVDRIINKKLVIIH